MGRKLLGYRVRGMSENAYYYANSERDCWNLAVTAPISKRGARHLLSDSGGYSTDDVGVPIEVSEIKIVAVYMKTNEYESSLASRRAIEDLSDFARAVVEEIDRRGIDAIVEPADFGGMPTTLRFRAPNGGFVWIPILAFSIVDGPKEERAKKTVDRMLDGIARLASSLSPCKENTTEVLQSIRERAQSIETHFRDFTGTKQPHSAKGAIKDFVAIVDDEIAKRSVVIP